MPEYESLTAVAKDGEEAKFFAPSDADDFRRALVVLLDSPELRRELGRKAKARVGDTHTWVKNSERVLGYWKGLLPH